MLATPVLFLVFNRPATTARVFQAIRDARPRRLYIAADGPRSSRSEDEALCDETRRICSQVDWDCEVTTLYREENLGCQLAVSTAVDWFFEQEEAGIILEDDCLPSRSFFSYCAELLAHYRDDEQVMCISGNNFQRGVAASRFSYYFSRYPHCWGWASWRRAWKHYDANMDQWQQRRNESVIDRWSDADESFRNHWCAAFDAAVSGAVDSWAYRWLYSCWQQGGLTCLPERNLVQNIGFADEATHTGASDVWYADLQAEELDQPLRHPDDRRRSAKADMRTDRYVFGIKNRGLAGRVEGLVTSAVSRIRSVARGILR